ncbi:hypothetical protein [Microbacterium immunditiarum]|uniref:Uncharacterized protein n=1 Tax=Microbacterium immunditiarum TaxID=337480 RepID=A0A7Y9KLG5_9MICO|nr:hypothetical protein [Microbacterium immunditiarum]NYE19719.1 hypothetical protein [Microbacterium immunditiarum]
MSAYDPLALFLLEQQGLTRELEHRRRIRELGLGRARGPRRGGEGEADAALRPAAAVNAGGRGRLLPGDA